MKGEVVAGRDSGGEERGKYNTVKRRCLGGTYVRIVESQVGNVVEMCWSAMAFSAS